MSQAPRPIPERRRECRRPTAFAFWFERRPRAERASGWMLESAASSASFLTAASAAPALGARLQLVEMFSRDRLVREDGPELPRFARVVRVEEPDGATRRVAVRFEAESPARTAARQSDRSAATCSREPAVSAPPPPPLVPHDGFPHDPVPVALTA